MCTKTCIDFAFRALNSEMVEGRRVLEVGSRDVNGSVRPVVEELQPAAYTGVDIEQGPRVDVVCDASELVDRFGAESFDVVISTELVEHVRDWRTAVQNMKAVLRSGGTLVVTTRSRGFWLHGWPWDYWRYEPEDMMLIFADMDIFALERDPFQPGVFLATTKLTNASLDLAPIALYSIVTGRRQLDVTDREVAISKVRHRASRAYWRGRAAAGGAARAVLRQTRPRPEDVGETTHSSST